MNRPTEKKLSGGEIALIASLVGVSGLALGGWIALIILLVKAGQLNAGFQGALHDTQICTSQPAICEKPTGTPANPTAFPDSFEVPIALFTGQLISNFEWNVKNCVDDVGSFGGLVVIGKLEAQLDTTPLIGYVAKDETNTCIYVIIRGTETEYEWQKDLQFNQVPLGNSFATCTGALVHSGFLSLFSCIKLQLKAYVASYTGAQRIVVAGHSLGGGLASLAGMYLSNNFTIPIFVYTFGKPRVGNIQYADCVNTALADRFYRVENTDDLIPQVPLAATPNLTNANCPWIYQHEGTAETFTTNWESLGLNHYMNVYLDYLQSI